MTHRLKNLIPDEYQQLDPDAEKLIVMLHLAMSRLHIEQVQNGSFYRMPFQALIEEAESYLHHNRKRICGECLRYGNGRNVVWDDCPRSKEENQSDALTIKVISPEKDSEPCEDFEFKEKNCGNCGNIVGKTNIRDAKTWGSFDGEILGAACGEAHGPAKPPIDENNYCLKWKGIERHMDPEREIQGMAGQMANVIQMSDVAAEHIEQVTLDAITNHGQLGDVYEVSEGGNLGEGLQLTVEVPEVQAIIDHPAHQGNVRYSMQNTHQDISSIGSDEILLQVTGQVVNITVQGRPGSGYDYREVIRMIQSCQYMADFELFGGLGGGGGWSADFRIPGGNTSVGMFHIEPGWTDEDGQAYLNDEIPFHPDTPNTCRFCSCWNRSNSEYQACMGVPVPSENEKSNFHGYDMCPGGDVLNAGARPITE